MNIAVTYENGQIFQHFGHCQQFKVYEVEGTQILSSKVIDANGIGGGARTALAQAGIQLYPGASGSADENVAALLAGALRYDPNTVCSHHHHEEGHTCGDHGCGEHHHDCSHHEH